MMRLDKYLTECSGYSRKEAKQLIGKGRVSINGEAVKRPECKVEPERDEIMLDGNRLTFVEYEYYMLNKPAGVVSATTDSRDTTVVELLNGISNKELFPVGRLDKDTEGLLILTNDGELAHWLLSPKYHVDKTYYVELDNEIKDEDIKTFETGMDIGEKKMTKPARLERITSKSAYVTICEGKYHQIKRMFAACEKQVLYLKRISMGGIQLDEALGEGEFRPLTEGEIGILSKNAEKESSV